MKHIRIATVLALTLLSACGGSGGLEVNQTTVYYDVRGNTEEELALQLNEKGTPWNDGQSYASTTAWNVTWDYEPDCIPWRCTAASFKVTVDISMRLPHWVHKDDVSSDLFLKWNTFSEKLLEHENGHRDRAIAGGAELLLAGQTLPSRSSREDLEKEVDETALQKMTELNAGQDEYDRVTVHGTSQGAVFP